MGKPVVGLFGIKSFPIHNREIKKLTSVGRLPPIEEWNAWVDFITRHINKYPMSGQAQLEVLEEPKAHPFSKQSQLQWAFNEL